MIKERKISLPTKLASFQVTSADEFVWIDSHNRLVEVVAPSSLSSLSSSTRLSSSTLDSSSPSPPSSGATAALDQRRPGESRPTGRSQGVGQQGRFGLDLNEYSRREVDEKKCEWSQLF